MLRPGRDRVHELPRSEAAPRQRRVHVCKSGYTTSSDACVEINECGSDNLASTDNCHTDATCTNLAGTFNCSCLDGYEGDGATCQDIDECSLGTHMCDVLQPGDAALSNQKLPRVASRGREVVKCQMTTSSV